MDWTHRKSYATLPLALLRIATFLVMACDTPAQAWVPGAGVGSVTLS